MRCNKKKVLLLERRDVSTLMYVPIMFSRYRMGNEDHMQSIKVDDLICK